MRVTSNMSQMTKALMAAAIVLGSGWCATKASANTESITHIAIVGDLHATSPARDTGYLPELAKLFEADIRVRDLKYKDLITLQTAGNAIRGDHRDSSWNRQILLKYRGAQPEDVPGFIANRLAALGKMDEQENSDLVWALTELSRTVDCNNQNVTVYLVSDVVEGGEVRDGRYFYESFSGAPFAGCEELVFIGFGSQFRGDKNVLKAAEQRLKEVMLDAGFASVDFRE